MTEKMIIDTILQSEDLPTLPAVAAKIVALSAEPEPDLGAIVQSLSQDLSLASKVLRVVNSPLYGFPGHVGTVSKAVSLLGSNSVRSLVLSFSLLEMRDRRANCRFDYERFWEHSLASAVTARRIMLELGDGNPEEAFLAGLLANVGQIVLSRAFRGRCDGAHAPEDGLFCPIERRLDGADHSVVGAHLCRHWRLPPTLEIPIRFHHAPEAYADDAPLERLVRICCLSGILADMFYSADPHGLMTRFLECSRDLLGLPESFFRALSSTVHAEVRTAADYFGLKVELDRSLEEILQEANLRLSQINLLYEQQNRELAQTKAELLRMTQMLEEKNLALERLANLDGLTGVSNRRYFEAQFLSELKRAARLGHSVGLILFDVDDFKRINDSCGHQAGDTILREMCRIVRRLLRDYDLLARYGGDEFVIILPETGLAEAQAVAERIEEEVRTHPFIYEGRIFAITISLGVTAETPTAEGDWSSTFISTADRCLITAKKEGKNRVAASPVPPIP